MKNELNILIDTDNNIFVGSYATEELADTVAEASGVNTLLVGEQKHIEGFKGKALVDLYNSMVTEKPVKKFANKDTAVTRVWNELISQDVQDGSEEVVVAKAPEKMPAKTTDEGGKKLGSNVNCEPRPMGEQVDCREGTKQAILIDALFDPEGVTEWELEAMLQEAGGAVWGHAQIMGGFYYDVHSLKGYGIRTEFHDRQWLFDHGHEATSEVESLDADDPAMKDVIAVHYLVLPEGMTAPLPHRVSAAKKKAAEIEAKADEAAKA